MTNYMKFAENQNIPRTNQNPNQQPNKPGNEPKEGSDETESAD